MSIGEFSEITRASIDSLRYYERKGIFSPAYVDPNTNYRYYNIEQIYELTLAKVCTEIGFSLSNLRDFSKKRDLLTLEDFFRQCEDATRKEARKAQGLALRMQAYREAYIDQITADVLAERPYTTQQCTVLLSPLDVPFEELTYRRYMETMSSLLRSAGDLDMIFLAEQGMFYHPDGFWCAYANILPEDHLADAIPPKSSLILHESPPVRTKIRSTMGSRISDAFHNALNLDKNKQPVIIQEAWAYSLATEFYLFNVFYPCD